MKIVDKCTREVAGSSPVDCARIDLKINQADVAQLVEHVIGNDEVAGSIPAVGSTSSLKLRSARTTKP